MKRKHRAVDFEKSFNSESAVRLIEDKPDDKGSTAKELERKTKFRKLAPTRPFPTIPTSISGSSPKSAHKEGRNFICVTRKTTLGTYLGRCKKLLMEEEYDVLHLHAMGAAIPHLLMLVVSLPGILPFAKEDIQLETRTGSVEVIDEVIPDDEDQDISMRRREKGSISVIFKLTRPQNILPRKTSHMAYVSDVDTAGKRNIVIVQEQEQEEEDIGQEIDKDT